MQRETNFDYCGLEPEGFATTSRSTTNERYMYPKTQERTLVKAKKLDVNDDGLLSLDELTSRRNQRFQKLDHNDDGQIDEAEFNARLVAMFNRMDSNSDGKLDDVEISKLKYRHLGKLHNSGCLYQKWF